MVVLDLVKALHERNVPNQLAPRFQHSSDLSKCSRHIWYVFQDSVHDRDIKRVVFEWQIFRTGLYDPVSGPKRFDTDPLCP